MSTMPLNEFDEDRISDELVAWLAAGNEPKHGWSSYLRLMAVELRELRMLQKETALALERSRYQAAERGEEILQLCAVRCLDAERVRQAVRDALEVVQLDLTQRQLNIITDRVARCQADLSAEERSSLLRLRSTEATIYANRGHLDASAAAQCGHTIGLLDRLLGDKSAAPALNAEERNILERLRRNEAAASASIGHLGDDIRAQCSAAITLLDRLLGDGQ